MIRPFCLFFTSLCYALTEVKITRIPSTNPPPPKRIYHFMDYNEVTSALLIFGGNQGINTVYNDIWAYDFTTGLYSNLVPTNDQVPDSRITSGGFVDSSQNKFFVFGGMTTNGPQNDLWSFELSGLKWNRESPIGPSPTSRYRYGYTKYYDGIFLKFIIFGGSLIDGESNETLVYHVSENTWEVLVVTGDIPPQLNGPTIQVVNGILYLFGGEVSSATEDSIIYFNDCYKLDLTSLVWSKLDLASKYDSRYFTGSAVIGSDLVLLYGWSNYLNDDARNIMKLSLENPIGWEEASLSESCSSVDSFAYATIDGSIYIFGGYVDGIYVNSMVKITDWVCTLVNDVDLSPPARMYHSLATINSKVYMYGGQGFDGKLEDMWEFNTNTLLWNAIKIEGLSPGARSSYSCASEGDIMIIWGGESSSSYLNDMYQFNAFDSSWKLISPTGIIPSARSGACIAMALPKIYIFGGKTTSGISNELWEYDTSLNEYLLLYSDGKGVKPDPVVFPTCEIVDGNFLVIFGTSDGEVPNSTAFLFNVTELLWTEVFYQDFSLFSRSLAVVKYLSGKVLVIGGQAWSTDPYKDSYLVDLATGEQVYLKSLPEYYYAGGFTMFKKNIYIFGGGSLIGNTMRVSVPSYNFFMYDLSDFGSPCPVICSKGSYDENGVCNECIAGSYTDLSGESICTPCSSGTYNYNDGANSVRQCYPCDQGTYAPHNGTKLCYICPNGYYCPIGSSTYFNSELASSSSSTQPPNYVANIAELNTKKSYLYISLSFVLIGLLVALRFIKYTKRILPILDLFKTEHNYTLNQPMVMVKNMIGGFFSVLFLLVAVLLIVSALLEYNINNIIESKALVPLVILENTTPTFTGQIEIDLTFYSYGGDCVDSTGNVLAKLTYVNLAYTYMKVSGSKNGEDCIISLVCSTCQVQTGAYIYYTFQEKSSYCSAFAVNIKAESSIPLSYSSISETVISGTNTVFRGYLATEFNILATPSSYEPASSSSAQVATGYHMSLDSNAVPGTTFYISDLPFSAGLNVQVNLIKSSNGLRTVQSDNQTLIILLSTLLGSVFGMMGAVSGVMRAIEGNQKSIISKFLSIRSHKNLKIRHKNLKHFLDSSSEKVDTRLKFSPDQSEVLSINSL